MILEWDILQNEYLDFSYLHIEYIFMQVLLYFTKIKSLMSDFYL